MSAPNNTQKSIMFITDGDSEADAMTAAFTRENYKVTCKTGIDTCLSGLAAVDTDLLIVDTDTLSLDNLTIYPQIRAVYSGLLVILSGIIHDTLQVLLYEQGVDDILVKPLDRLLLLARIRALLRRSRSTKSRCIRFGDGFEINSSTRRATSQGEEIPLTSREFDLLWYLALNAGTTLDRDQLYNAVFGIDYNGYDRSIDMYISRIRSKISPEKNPSGVIKTVRGKGYLFAAE